MLLVLLLVALAVPPAAAGVDRATYYKLVDAVQAGTDFYAVLEVPWGAAAADIKKAYRQKSRTVHPDRNPSPDAHAEFIALAAAYEVLSDEEQRKSYEELWVYGIPLQDRYYGQYAYKAGAPDIPLWKVLVSLLVGITVCKWLYLEHRYRTVNRLVRKTTQFEKQVEERLRDIIAEREANGEALRGKNGKIKKEVKARLRIEAEETTDVDIVGLVKPSWRNLFVFDVIWFPWRVGRFFYRIVHPPSADEELRMRLQMEDASEEEWQEELAEINRRRDQMKISDNRMKQIRRRYKKAGVAMPM